MNLKLAISHGLLLVLELFRDFFFNNYIDIVLVNIRDKAFDKSYFLVKYKEQILIYTDIIQMFLYILETP